MMSLTSYIVAVQRKQKSSAVFIDLSAAHDTVWRHELPYKLFRIIACVMIVQLIVNMYGDRGFQIATGFGVGTLLSSLYIAEMQGMSCRKFGYTDDWVIATRCGTPEVTEQV